MVIPDLFKVTKVKPYRTPEQTYPFMNDIRHCLSDFSSLKDEDMFLQGFSCLVILDAVRKRLHPRRRLE